jgi:aryl sulfotransferase
LATAVTPSNIVWLASYPKSGNTWFRLLRANLESGRDAPADINASLDQGHSVLSRESFDHITMLESGMLTADEVDALRPAVCEALAVGVTIRTWVKAHDAWRLNARGEPLFGRDTARAAIYLVRDPRDVAVSLAHHLGATIDRTIALMNSPGAALCRSGNRQNQQLFQELGDWSRHVLSWLDQTDVPVHIVLYEALKRDTACAFEAALRFAGETPAREEVERAVRGADFGRLSAQEKAVGFRERTSPESLFFRRGEVGGWRQELTDAQAARIVEAHEPVMRRLGYLAPIP